jgi:hypothetical protein
MSSTNQPTTQSQNAFTPQATPAQAAVIKAAAPAGKSFWDIAQPFVIGGLSGCIATSIIQPVDMIKVTIQLKSEEIAVAKKAGKEIKGDVSFTGAIRDIYKSGGIKAFYKGFRNILS